MATQELIKTEDVPTLNTVIEAGDETVIQTKRISHQIGHELDSNLGPSLSREIIQALASRSASGPANTTASDLPDESHNEPHHDSANEAMTSDSNEPDAGRSDQKCPDETGTAEMNSLEMGWDGVDADETLELMIDTIVDRHITSLRQDIRRLLERALTER